MDRIREYFCSGLGNLLPCMPQTAAAGLLRAAPLGPWAAAAAHPGFNFSVEFRRNFGIFFVFASYREVKFRYFSFSNLKIQKYL